MIYGEFLFDFKSHILLYITAQFVLFSNATLCRIILNCSHISMFQSSTEHLS